MQKTVVGVFKSESEAHKAVGSLRENGFRDQEISIVAKDDGKRRQGNQTGGGTQSNQGGRGQGSRGGLTQGMQNDSISDGLASGAAWGGLAGLALGAGALAIPGLGPIVAAGPIAAALTGAATGGLAGGLIDWGIPEESGRQLQEEVRRGNILALLQCSEDKVDRAANILRENGAKNVDSHASRR
ncbi:MAG: hypothetical protein FD169_1290 [Bacillota bacterium]|nr:MAG: hypothetical protein FD169_1290 [Bacillota bacterium]MBS3950615.1 hypothetical protein [Peptococcaceae bacterium]